MKRRLMQCLDAWKTDPHRKPLILNGARQVGKTWLLREFGHSRFDNVAYVNFDNNATMRELFAAGYNIKRLLSGISVETGELLNPQTTLIIFDEIQECPQALTSLKYFREQTPEYCIVAAGSLLGLATHHGTGYPVGNVQELNLYPLNYREFLEAKGDHELVSLLDEADAPGVDIFRDRFIQTLREYYLVGGMPEVVSNYLDQHDFSSVRKLQQQILTGYIRDVTKHLSGNEIERTLAAWQSIPAHLGQENKKFVFGHIATGARARDYRAAITWLAEAGIALIVPKISKPSLPLSAYAQDGAFKLFLHDVGLLTALTGLDEKSVLMGNEVFTEFKGALTEQFICQQLVSDADLSPYYWSSSNSQAEVDFVVQSRGVIYALEVKAEENLRSKSLAIFSKKYSQVRARRFSLAPLRDDSWMRNVPLYAIGSRTLWE